MEFFLVFLAFIYWDTVLENCVKGKNYTPPVLSPSYCILEDNGLGIWHRAFFFLSRNFQFHLPHRAAGTRVDSSDNPFIMMMKQILNLIIAYCVGVKCLYVAHMCMNFMF